MEQPSVDFDPVIATPARIKDEYVTFFNTIQNMKYRRTLFSMPGLNQESLVVDFEDLMIFNLAIAFLYGVYPEFHSKLLREAALEVLSIENPSYSDRLKIEDKFFMEVDNPYEDPIPIRLDHSIHPPDMKIPTHEDIAISLYHKNTVIRTPLFIVLIS